MTEASLHYAVERLVRTVIDDRYGNNPTVLTQVIARLTEHLRRMDELDAEADLETLPVVAEFGGRGGELRLGPDRLFYRCAGLVTTLRARPQELRAMLAADQPSTTADFVLERRVQTDVLGTNELVHLTIIDQKGTGTPQELNVLYRSLLQGLDEASIRFA